MAFFVLSASSLRALGQDCFAKDARTRCVPERAEPEAGAVRAKHKGIYPKLDATGKKQASPVAYGSGSVTYYGGPVISNAQIVVVFWGSKVDATTQSGITGFYQALVGSPFMDMLGEYNTITLTPGSNQTIGHGSVKGEYTITPSAASSGSLIDDYIVQKELLAQLKSGVLPAPTADSTGHPNTIYMIYFPPGVKLEDADVGTSCVQYCAYHNATFAGNTYNGLNLYFGIFPDFGPHSGCSTGCGNGATAFDNLTAVSSHELAETITDGQGALTNALAAPTGWYGQNQGEIGDICLGNDAAGPSGYWVQLQWSNIQEECVEAPAHLEVAAPPTVYAGIPFNVNVTARESSSYDNLLPNYNETVGFQSSDGAGLLPSNFTFGYYFDYGVGVFPLTLNTVGTQTITVTDTRVPLETGTATVTVLPAVTEVTLTTSPPGAAVMVDGTAYPTPQTLQWGFGSTHTIAVGAQETGAPGEQLTFLLWSDGGPASHTVFAPSGPTPSSYTAYFTTDTNPQRPGRGTRPAAANGAAVTKARRRVPRQRSKAAEVRW